MFLYLRTGRLIAPLAAHVFCNWMGFPDFLRILRHPGARLALPVGIAAFFFALRPWTRPIMYSLDTARADDIAPAFAQAFRLGSHVA
jgi:prenyl protein peptidase